MMDKKKVRLRVCYLLDICHGCVKAPKASPTGSVSVGLREEVCGRCDTHKELKKLRPILDGKKKKSKKEEAEELNLTAEEFVQLHYVDKKTAAEMAELKNVSTATIYNFKSDHKEEIFMLLREKGLRATDAPRSKKKKTAAVTPAPAPEIEITTAPVAHVINWKEKYEEANALIEGQKVEIKGLLERINQLQGELKETQAANGLHAACEDIENGLADIRKENEMLREENARFIEQNHKYRTELEKEQQHNKFITSNYSNLMEENKHLRGLVKLWL